MAIGSGISGGISAVNTAHTTGVTVDLPSGLSSGNFMVLFVFKDFDTASTFNAISGWTRVTALNTVGTSGRNRQSATWYRVYDGTEGSSITSTGTGTDAHENSAVIIGWPDSDGFDVTPTTAHKNAQDNSFTPTCEPITTVTDGAIVATFSGMTFSSMDPWVAPTGYTMVDGEVTPTQGKLGVAEKVKATAGLETPGDWNNTNGDSRDESVVITLAIKPSAGGGGSDATGNVTLPSLTLSGAALVAYLASGASTFPSLQFGGTAAVANTATTSGQIDFPSLTASGFALLTQNASGVFLLPSLSVTGSSDTAYLSAGGITLPSLTTTGVAAAAVLGQATGNIILPQLTMLGVGLIALNASGSFTLPQILLAGEASGPVLGGGAIRVINSTDLAEYVNASVSYQEGIIAVDDVGTDLHPSNGIYYVSNQRIAVSFGVSVSRIAGGIPFTSAGRIAMSTSPVSYYANNLPFTANGQIAISQVSNVIRCSDIVSCTDIIPCGG